MSEMNETTVNERKDRDMIGRDLIRESECAVLRTFAILALAMMVMFLVCATAEAQEVPDEPTSAPVARDDTYELPANGWAEIDLLANDENTDGAIICSLLDAGEFSGGLTWQDEGQSFERGKMTYSAFRGGTYRWSYELCSLDESGKIVRSNTATVTFEVFDIILPPPPLPPEYIAELRAEVKSAKKEHVAALGKVRDEKRDVRKADSRAERLRERRDVRVAVRKSRSTGAALRAAQESYQSATER